MTAQEQAAFAGGIETARQMALAAAVTIEVREDAREIRQQAAAAALQGLADGLASTFLGRPDAGAQALERAFAEIAADPADGGTIPCPRCGGSLDWIRAGEARHFHGQCRAEGCQR